MQLSWGVIEESLKGTNSQPWYAFVFPLETYNIRLASIIHHILGVTNICE